MFELISVFASAARTATPTAAVIQIPAEAMYVDIEIEATAINLTPSVVFNVEYQASSGAWVVALASAAVTAVSTVLLRLGPDVATTANLSAPLVLPSNLRIRPVHGDADSITYSVVAKARG
ncbi:MAG TPA: hypothetical protein VLA89_15615 [Gemmatimonadales bacterium]|nr:hypothetical protein [Gemmatimonadales bacterium]